MIYKLMSGKPPLNFRLRIMTRICRLLVVYLLSPVISKERFMLVIFIDEEYFVFPANNFWILILLLFIMSFQLKVMKLEKLS